ncbi:MAG: type II toxin-antitoxin system VapC family toxin [Dehalococcoidia bacterium]
MKYLLDADSTIDHLSHHTNLLTRIPDLRPRDLALAAVTLIELYTGVEGSRQPALAGRDLRHFLRYVRVIPLNQRVIRAAARLRAQLRSQNRPIKHRAYDIIVAATAREYGLIVVTSNTRDYQDISGLSTFDPRSGRLTTH